VLSCFVRSRSNTHLKNVVKPLFGDIKDRRMTLGSVPVDFDAVEVPQSEEGVSLIEA